MKEALKYTAVGVSYEEKTVVICFDGQITIRLNEGASRKLADDILRNANYLWPVEEKDA
jgi:hypothetical protein